MNVTTAQVPLLGQVHAFAFTCTHSRCYESPFIPELYYLPGILETSAAAATTELYVALCLVKDLSGD